MAYDFRSMVRTDSIWCASVSDRERKQMAEDMKLKHWQDKNMLIRNALAKREATHVNSFCRMLGHGYCKVLTDEDVMAYADAQYKGAGNKCKDEHGNYCGPTEIDGELGAFLQQHDGLVRINPKTGSATIYTGSSYVEAFDDMADGLRSVNSGVWTYFDTEERQLRNEKEIAEEQAVNKTMSSVTLDPRNAAEELADKGSARNVPLIVTYSKRDIKYNDKGKMLGANVDVQYDQSQLTDDMIKQGQGHSSPSVNYMHSKNKAADPHKVYYTANQLSKMESAGASADYKGIHGISVTGNLYVKENPKTGSKCTIITMPKDLSYATTPQQLETMTFYNKMNQLGPSIHTEGFTADTLKQQFDVTNKVRDMTAKKEAFANKVRESENQVEQEQVVEQEDDLENPFA